MLFQFFDEKTRKTSKYNGLGPQDHPKVIEKEEASREDSDGFLIRI